MRTFNQKSKHFYLFAKPQSLNTLKYKYFIGEII